MKHRINKKYKSNFKSTFGDDFRLEPPIGLSKKNWGYTAYDLDEVMKKHEEIIEMRGRIVSACLAIERRIGEYILDIFCKKNMKSLFTELILEKEFFTFMNKWKILRELTHILKVENISEKERKELLTLLREVIETRDRFAHGKLSFYGKKPQLYFQSGGRRLSLFIDKKFFSDFEKKFKKSIHLFDKLTRGKYMGGSIY